MLAAMTLSLCVLCYIAISTLPEIESAVYMYQLKAAIVNRPVPLCLRQLKNLSSTVICDVFSKKTKHCVQNIDRVSYAIGALVCFCMFCDCVNSSET